MGRSGCDVGPPEPGEYRHVVVGVLAEELADSVLECSGNRRKQRARALAGPVQRPLAGVRVVQAESKPGESLRREGDLVEVRVAAEVRGRLADAGELLPLAAGVEEVGAPAVGDISGAEILEPAELRDQAARTVRAMAAIYG